MSERQQPEQKGSGGAGDGWAILGTLITGIAVWGGIGWLADSVLNTRFMTPIGLVVGGAAAVYIIVKRYGM
jgi:F0F1-type ATP synthase assembly protein I